MISLIAYIILSYNVKFHTSQYMFSMPESLVKLAIFVILVHQSNSFSFGGILND